MTFNITTSGSQPFQGPITAQSRSLRPRLLGGAPGSCPLTNQPANHYTNLAVVLVAICRPWHTTCSLPYLDEPTTLRRQPIN